MANAKTNKTRNEKPKKHWKADARTGRVPSRLRSYAADGGGLLFGCGRIKLHHHHRHSVRSLQTALPHARPWPSATVPIPSTPTNAVGSRSSFRKKTFRSFAPTRRLAEEKTAFDTAAAEGKTTFVFPLSKHRHQRPAIYNVNETIRVHGSVTNVVGMYSDIALTPSLADSAKPLFSVENITGPGIRFGSFNVSSGWPPKENFVSVHNAGDNTIILTHTGLGGKAHTNEPGKGKLFIENFCAKGWDFKGTKVWARQLNPESGGADVDYGAIKHSLGNIEATGTDLWILGLKTEGKKTALAIHDNSRAEIIGGFIFPYRNTVQDVPGFLVEKSAITASFVNDQNRYKPVFRIKNGDNSRDISNDGTVHIWGGNGLIVPLFVTP